MVQYNKNIKNKKKGFTLVELMVVLAITAILAALVGGGLIAYTRLARFEKNEANARTLFQTAQISLTRMETAGELDAFRRQVMEEGDTGDHFQNDVTVTDAGGICRLSLGELTVDSPDAAAFFTPFTLFDLPEGCFTDSREENGLTIYEGTRGEERFRVAVDAAGRPVRLEGNVGGEEIGVTVTKFEFDTPSEGTERERKSA